MSKPFSYLPHTEADRLQMLRTIGVRSFEELITTIPNSVRTSTLNLPEGLSELELAAKLSKLAKKNRPVSEVISFLGGGSYNRYVPAAVSAVVSRSEFATAYTPYQPEVSQGTLQAIYEFQSAVCMLTGMDIANASVYDGPTAAAEAALMAARLTQKSKIIIPESLNPEYKAVIATYSKYCGIQVEWLPTPEGTVACSKLRAYLDGETAPMVAALVVQYPNYFGCFEDIRELAQVVQHAGAKLIVACDPISLGFLEAPGNLGADIVVGDAQSCGNYLSFGGPSAGFMATRKEYMRQLPGRIAGMTMDNRGSRAFALTLQTREQHIRRAGATSNICTNQALNALSMLVYLTVMGPEGLCRLCKISAARAHYLAGQLCGIQGIKRAFSDQEFFNEFVIEVDLPADMFLKALERSDILGGIALNSRNHSTNRILVCVTEMNSVEDINKYIQAAKQAMTSVLYVDTYTD